MNDVRRPRPLLARIQGRLEAAVSPTLIIVLALLALAPLLTASGIIATRAAGDSPFLLQRTHQMAAALAGGHFPPRWMPDAAYGLGYPFWNYYAPLAWLVAGAIAALGGGVVGAVKVTTALCFVVAALGAARLARGEWGRDGAGAGAGRGDGAGRGAGLLAAAAYTFAPYHLVNVYSRGDALSELAAYAVFPWLLVAIRRVAAAPSSRRIATLALLVALLGISHNISALLFAPLALAYGLWRVWPDIRGAARGLDGRRPQRERENAPLSRGWRAAPELARSALRRLEWRLWPWLRATRRPSAAIAAGFALGGGLAAWFWAPALLEREAVQLGNALGGHFDYVNHFRGLDLFDLRPAFDFDAEAGAPSRIGLAQLLLAVAGGLAWAVSRRKRSTVIFWAGAVVATGLMATPLSRPLWAVLPLLPYAQFPWRWLGVTALALAILTAPLAPWLADRLRRPVLGGPLALLFGSMLALSALGDLVVEPLPVGEVTVADQMAFELFSGNIGTTVRNEYVPIGVEPRPRSSGYLVDGGVPHPHALAGRLESAVRLRNGAAWSLWQIEVVGDGAAEIAFPTLWFPGWYALVDDQALSGTYPAPGSGWLVATVPPGRHLVDLRLGRSTVRAAAEAVSLLALLIFVALRSVDRGRRPWFALLALGALLAACVGIARILPDGAGTAGPRTLDWPRAPYPHAVAGGVAFDDSRLISAHLNDGGGGSGTGSPPTIEAGGGLMVELEWSGARTGRVVQTALVAAVEPQSGFGAPDVRAISEQPMADDGAHELEVPAETPSGLYFVRVRVRDDLGRTGGGTDVPARSPAGAEIGQVYLGPVRVRGRDRFREDLPSTPVLRAAGIVLHSVQTVQDGSALEVRMLWDVDQSPLIDYKTSVRLLPPTGDEVLTDGEGAPIQVDHVPLYGMTPPSVWRAGQLVHDRRWLVLPDGFASGDNYRLEIVLYEAHGEQRQLGSGRVSAVAIEAVGQVQDEGEDRSEDEGQGEGNDRGGDQDQDEGEDRTEDADVD